MCGLLLLSYDKCDYSWTLPWPMGWRMPSGTVPVTFQSEEDIDRQMKKGFVEEVSLESTFRSKLNVDAGNLRLASTESTEEISRSEVNSTGVHF